MIVLGLHSATFPAEHDCGATIVRDGEIVAACEEERFVRIKSPLGMTPVRSIAACLRIAGLSIRDVDVVADTGATQSSKKERVSQYLRHFFGYAPPVQLINHHVAHLASAFLASGYEEAMCLSCDAWGDRISTARATGSSSGIDIVKTYPKENSLGLFYSAITSFLGFTVGTDEYKVMGLAAYGNPGVDLSAFAQPTAEGHAVDLGFMTADFGNRTTNEPYYSGRLIDLLGAPRSPDAPISQRHRDVAYAAQETLESCLVSLVREMHECTGHRRLCFAGGVALNCVANRILLEQTEVEELFVQPAASDRGLALGTALQAAFAAGERIRPLEHVFLGPEYSDDEILSALVASGFCHRAVKDPEAEAAALLANGEILGWYQGRSEFGPRALGNRSILADPRLPDMKDQVNARIKFREGFRPFAPAVLAERASEIFEMSDASPFMTVAYRTKPDWRDRIPSVVHVDGTARVQTVDRERCRRLHKLIRRFAARTGVPVVLNTSFNLRGQPIVETPADAVATFAASGLRMMFLGRFLVSKDAFRGSNDGWEKR